MEFNPFNAISNQVCICLGEQRRNDSFLYDEGFRLEQRLPATFSSGFHPFYILKCRNDARNLHFMDESYH